MWSQRCITCIAHSHGVLSVHACFVVLRSFGLLMLRVPLLLPCCWSIGWLIIWLQGVLVGKRGSCFQQLITCLADVLLGCIAVLAATAPATCLATARPAYAAVIGILCCC